MFISLLLWHIRCCARKNRHDRKDPLTTRGSPGESRQGNQVRLSQRVIQGALMAMLLAHSFSARRSSRKKYLELATSQRRGVRLTLALTSRHYGRDSVTSVISKGKTSKLSFAVLRESRPVFRVWWPNSSNSRSMCLSVETSQRPVQPSK